MFCSVIWDVFPKLMLFVLAYLRYETELSQMSYLIRGPLLQKLKLRLWVNDDQKIVINIKPDSSPLSHFQSAHFFGVCDHQVSF